MGNNRWHMRQHDIAWKFTHKIQKNITTQRIFLIDKMVDRLLAFNIYHGATDIIFKTLLIVYLTVFKTRRHKFNNITINES